MKERNRLRFLDLEIKRKFPFCTSQSLDETTKSIQSLNETLNKPIEAHLKLYQNHSLTYTFEEKKQRNQQKLDNLKETMLNYIQNMTANRFDGEFFLQQSSEKQRKVLNKKAEKLKNIRKTARNFIEPVNKKLEDHLLNKSSGHLKEEFKDKMKEIDFQNEKHQQRVEREKEKLNEKIEKLVSKREEYKLKGESIRFELAQKDSFRIQSKLKDYEEKNNLMTLQRELNVAKQLKNINLHEKRLEINRQKVLKQMQEKEQKLINDFMGDFQHKYENSLMKKQEVIKKNLFKLTNESKSYVETIQLNRERILERQKDKEDYFKQKLNNDTEKVARAQNIKEFIRRKTIIQEEDRFKKNREKKEEHDLMFDKKKVTIVLKEVQNKRKINFNKKENDFVVEERRDYSNKLSNYREVMLKNIKV